MSLSGMFLHGHDLAAAEVEEPSRRRGSLCTTLPVYSGKRAKTSRAITAISGSP